MMRQTAVFLLFLLLAALEADGIGVNWGTSASHPLPPEKVVRLLKSNRINRVRLLDAEPQILKSLSGSGIRLTLGIPNSLLPTLNSSLKAAENWVHENLTRFVAGRASGVVVDYVAVGEEPFLRGYGDQYHPFVVGAAENIRRALSNSNLADSVKVVCPCSFDAFSSKSRFRRDVNATMVELLKFLKLHRSPFFVTISPFRSYRESRNFSLGFALFRETSHPVNDSQKTYNNLFDLSYYSVVSALSAAGFPKMEIIVSQTGWPSDGAPEATPDLAHEFNTALISHLDAMSSRPSEVYISSLFDEDKRSASTGDFERHWGVFTFDGQAKYELNLGQGSHKKLANLGDVQYLQARWCVVNENLDLTNASSVALDACAGSDCSALSAGSSCFNLSWPANVSYAFNSYYQLHDQAVGSCDFSGLGLLTTVDPSVDRCRFVVGLKSSDSIPHRSAAFLALIFAISLCFW